MCSQLPRVLKRSGLKTKSGLLGIFIIRRLQSDNKFSAAGEKFHFKYVIRSLKDWKTWIASGCIH